MRRCLEAVVPAVRTIFQHAATDRRAGCGVFLFSTGDAFRQTSEAAGGAAPGDDAALTRTRHGNVRVEQVRYHPVEPARVRRPARQPGDDSIP